MKKKTRVIRIGAFFLAMLLVLTDKQVAYGMTEGIYAFKTAAEGSGEVEGGSESQESQEGEGEGGGESQESQEGEGEGGSESQESEGEGGGESQESQEGEGEGGNESQESQEGEGEGGSESQESQEGEGEGGNESQESQESEGEGRNESQNPAAAFAPAEPLAVNPDDREFSTLPKTLEELAAWQSKELLVTSLGDLLVVQDLSRMTDFAGYTIRISARTVASSNEGQFTWELEGTEFDGLGSEQFPFRGTLQSAYENGSLVYKLDNPFFRYLSTDAVVREMTIIGKMAVQESTPQGVLAGVLAKGAKDISDAVTLHNVVVNGEVSNTGGAAGLLFGRVENLNSQNPVRLSIDSGSVRLVQNIAGDTSGMVAGIHAGGIAGEIRGNVILEIQDPGALGNLTVKSVSMWGNADNVNGQLTWEQTGAGGMYAGAFDGGAMVIKGNSAGYSVNVQGTENPGGANGGFVGMALGTEVRTESSADLPIIISGTGVTGRIAGGIIGYYDRRDENGSLQIDYVRMEAPINAEGNGGYFAGGVMGRYYRNEDGSADGVFDVINHVTVSGNVAAACFAGGVAGMVHGSNIRLGGENKDSIVVTGAVTNSSVEGGESNVRGAGGIVGLASGQYIEIENAAVRTNFHENAFATGGIVGAVDNRGRSSVLKIKDVSVNSVFAVAEENSDRYRGGVLGMVFPGSMVALDGKLDVQMTTANSQIRRAGRTGHIAGYQKESLIYFEPTAVYTRPGGKNWVDDIGNYGGVYRNGSWGEQDLLISYEEGGVKGSVGRTADTWVLDSEADLLRLVVALNSQGRFGTGCFENTDKAALLAGDYSIGRSLDLTNSGVYSLNRNDAVGLGEIFTGSLKGTGSRGITIQMGDLKTHQSNVALFPAVGGGAEVSGFRLERSIDGAMGYAAGVGCLVLGAFTARDLDIRADITTYYEDNTNRYLETGGNATDTRHYYGGLAACADSRGATVFSAEDIKIGGRYLTPASENAGYPDSLRMGGLIGKYEQSGDAPSQISVDGFELMEDFQINSSSVYAGGMITLLNEAAPAHGDATVISMSKLVIHNGASLSVSHNTDKENGRLAGGWLGFCWKNIVPDKDRQYSVDGITIGDGGEAGRGPSFVTAAYFGGLLGTVTGRLQLKNIDFKNAVFENTAQKAGNSLLIRIGDDALIEIDGYRIDGRELGDDRGADNSGNVQIRGCSEFREIVGRNVGIYTDETLYHVNEYQNGGIVNLIYDNFSDKNSAGHGTARDRLLPSENNGTVRYYYNLFGNSFAEENTYLAENEKLTAGNMVITNEKQMMIWHLSQYMNDSIRRYLAPYYVNEKISSPGEDAVFRGSINLDKVSYYPTPVTGGVYTFENGMVEFHGQDIADKAGEAMTPSSPKKPHYMMHGGLLLSHTGDVTVKGRDMANGLILKGSVTNLGPDSGALFPRTIQGRKQVYYIKLDGLFVADYNPVNPAANHEVGLLIGAVNDRVMTEDGPAHEDTLLDMSWIETTGYQGFTKKAASALIGRTGDAEAANVSVEFKNMKIDSRRDGIFQYASLIDKNYYVDDTQENEGSAESLRRLRYLFTEAAFSGSNHPNREKRFPFDGSNPYYGNNEYQLYGAYVTIGAELADGIEYWDVEYGPKEDTDYNLPFVGEFTWNETNVRDKYLPYVHTRDEGSKEIEVNPKNVSIEKGCGTYEDPYIIDNPKQLLALTRYLQNKNDYKYLGGWRINAYESGRRDGGSCDGSHEPIEHPDSDLQTYPMTGGELPEDFPTQEELSRAYYMITDDIDLSAMANATDRQIAEDFVGFGTERMPFRGVFVGAERDYDNNQIPRCPQITLAQKKKWTSVTANVNHGLIQYAKGAVVKDLAIKGAEDSADGTRTGVIRVTGAAGGVIACVLGGDNIIDNVSVEMQAAVRPEAGQKAQPAQAGAYVGNVRQGSVILRNLKEDAASGFEAGLWNAGESHPFEPFSATDLESYPYVSGLIGKVEDGCVIYEDTFGGGAPYASPILGHGLKNISGIYKNASLPICSHYDILVKSHLYTGEPDKIKTTMDSSGGSFTVQVDTAAQLQIVSMAINSDAFSVYHKDGGYNKDAVCRKAEYSQVGRVTDQGNGSDFTAAITEDDDIYYYPYLYDFFDFNALAQGRMSTLTGDETTGYTSLLNAATKEAAGLAVMNYRLKPAAYDMSVYDRGFRGLGASYGMFENRTVDADISADVLNGSFYSDFRANFDGAGATIHIALDRGYDGRVHTAALFNDLLDREVAENRQYTIQNMTVTGKVSSVDGDTDGNSDYPNRTAGVIGLMRRPWKLNNIAVKDMQIDGKGHTAGIVAWIEPEAGKAQSFVFEGCSVLENTGISAYGGSAGGILGVMTQNGDSAAFGETPGGRVSLDFRGCSTVGTAGKEVTIEVKDRTADTDSADGHAQYIQRAVGRSGGLAGYIGRRHKAAAIPAVSVVVKEADDGRGNKRANRIAYASVRGAYSTGGILGGYDCLQTEEGTVRLESAEVMHCEIEGRRGNMAQGDDISNYGVGGLIGELGGYSLVIGGEDEIPITDTNVIASAGTGFGMYAGGAVGCLKARDAEIKGLRVTGVLDSAVQAELELGGQQYTISSGRRDAGGIIGRAVDHSDSRVSSKLRISDVQVSGMSIMVDSWGTDGKGNEIFKEANAVSGHAGGVVGLNEAELTIEGTRTRPGEILPPGRGATVEHCMILTSGGSTGGIVGALSRNNTLTQSSHLRSTRIWDVVVENSIIGFNNLYKLIQPTGGNDNYKSGAGGIYGKIYNTNNDRVSTRDSRHQLENARISGCWIYGPNAGGALGTARGMAGYSYQAEENQLIVEIRDNKIYGSCVGGAIGNYENAFLNYIGMSITDNRLQAWQNGGRTAYAGGFAGYASSNSKLGSLADRIQVKNNHILAANTDKNKNISAGGFYGYMDTYVVAYWTEIIDNLIGYSESDNGALLVTGAEGGEGTPGGATLQSLFHSTKGEISAGQREVFLIRGKNPNSYEKEPMPSVEDLKNNQTGYYAVRIGSFVGSYGTRFNDTRFVAPVVSYGAGITVRPVVDVGMNTPMNPGAAESQKLFDQPYAYREFIHIVYHDRTQQPDEDAEVWNKVSSIEGSTADNWKYLFDGISYRETIEKYRKTKTTNQVSEYLDAYRLNIRAESQSTETVEGVYEKLYRNQEGALLSPLEYQGEMLPAIVLDTQYGTADELLKGVVAALTGAGGIYGSDDNGNYSNGVGSFVTIEAKAMQINRDGTITATGERSSLLAEKRGNRWAVDYQTYDNDGTDGNPQTFTLLTLTYFANYSTFDGAQRFERREVIRIPVFVMVRLGIDTHFKIMEDLEYNGDKIQKEGFCSSVTIANDSSYTLYMEYIYDSARKKYGNVKVEKKIGMINTAEEEVGFAKGTKLTLIDVSDNHKVYYYTVGDNPGPYAYTEFRDEEGNPYQNKEIGLDAGFDIYDPGEFYETRDMSEGKEEIFTYSDVAVERFLITVDISDVKKEDRINTESRRFDTSPEISEGLKKRTTVVNHTNIQARIQPGMNISFYQKGEREKEEKTWIEGSMKAAEDGIVNIWATIDIKADALYWSAVGQDGANTIDSANSNKYLEIQTYLTAPDGKEVTFPDGTNVFIQGERTRPALKTEPGKIEETGLGVYDDVSNIYFYKDGNLRLSLNKLLDLIKKEQAEHGVSQGVIRWANQIRLDFRNADMAPYDEEKYGVNLRLLRVEEPEYPAAGELLDSYSQEVPAARKSELACAVEAGDLLQLGINTYEGRAEQPHAIDFDFKLDFSGILTGNDINDRLSTNKQYIVAYRLLQKTNTSGAPGYVPYMGDEVRLELVNDPSGLSLQQEVSSHPDSAGIPFWYVNYSFDFDREIQQGLITRRLRLTVEDASKMDLSNYQVQAIVYMLDKGVDPLYQELNLNSQTPLSDFFVFTVAKLKTDLDY